MKQEELIRTIVRYIPDDRIEVLSESYGSIDDGLNDLYRAGVEFQIDERLISNENLRVLFEHTCREFGLDETNDYEIVDFLVCFELGFNAKIAPVLRERSRLKAAFGGLIFAAHRFSRIRKDPVTRGSITESEIFQTLSDAQDARWRCDFHKCFRIIDSLNKRLINSGLSSAAKQFWGGKHLRPQSRSFIHNKFRKGTFQRFGSGWRCPGRWGNQHNYVKLAHAYFRKAVLYRQKALLDPTPRSSLISCLDTMLEAEGEVKNRLVNLKDKDCASTLFSLYIELAKAYGQAGMFSDGWHFIHMAEEQLHSIVDLPLDVTWTSFEPKQLFWPNRTCWSLFEINMVEKCIEEMHEAINTAETLFANDLVLREILIKDLIPLIAVVGNSGMPAHQEKAQELLLECRQQAKHLKLFHQMRGLKFIASKYSLHLEE